MKTESEKVIGHAVLKYEIQLLRRRLEYLENLEGTFEFDALIFEGYEDYEDVSDEMFAHRIAKLMEARKELDLAELPFKLSRMLLAEFGGANGEAPDGVEVAAKGANGLAGAPQQAHLAN